MNFPYIGNYIIQVDLYMIDDLDIAWHYLDHKNQINVKVEEDPVRQKLFAALAASNAAAAAASLNNPTTSNNSQPMPTSITPNGNNIPLMYQQRNVTPTNDAFDTKMEI